MRALLLILLVLPLNACTDKSTDAVAPTDSGAYSGEGEGEGEGEVEDCPRLSLSTMALQISTRIVADRRPTECRSARRRARATFSPIRTIVPVP